MKTFKANVIIDVRIVVPDQFVADLRRDAVERSTAFLKAAHEMHPVNDEAFVEACLKNGLRSSIRANLLELLANSGLGGSVSPATVIITGTPPEHDAPTNVHCITRDKLIEQAPDSAEVTLGVSSLAGSRVIPPAVAN